MRLRTVGQTREWWEEYRKNGKRCLDSARQEADRIVRNYNDATPPRLHREVLEVEALAERPVGGNGKECELECKRITNC